MSECLSLLSGVCETWLCVTWKPLGRGVIETESVRLFKQVHTACMDLYPRKCPLGQCKVSIIPPTALNSIDSDGTSLNTDVICGKQSELKWHW